jgi:hypothetical protein
MFLETVQFQMHFPVSENLKPNELNRDITQCSLLKSLKDWGHMFLRKWVTFSGVHASISQKTEEPPLWEP